MQKTWLNMSQSIDKKFVGQGGRFHQTQNEAPILARLSNAYCSKRHAGISVCLKLSLIGIAVLPRGKYEIAQ
jgi:hypothetical protein